MFNYRISGLTVAADRPLPGAIALSTHPQHIDVHLQLSDVPERLLAPTARGHLWEVNHREYLLNLPDVGRFYAADGAILNFEVAPGAPPENVTPYLTGIGLGALLYQRGSIILHASAVEHKGHCIAICAPSGTGKSTLAGALCRMGCRLVSDDVTSITLNSSDLSMPPLVQPDGRCLKLYDVAIDQLEFSARRQQAVQTNIDKYYVEPPAALSTPCPLKAVYILRDAKSRSDAPSIAQQTLLNSAHLLLNNSYRRKLALAMMQQDPRLSKIKEAVLRIVPIFILTRPRDLNRLEEVAENVFKHWSKLNISELMN